MVPDSSTPPNGIDIDAAGDVFVTETLNSRVSQFSSTGTFVRAWGRDVDPAGGTGFEVCTTATGCKAGISSGGAAGTLNVPNRLAISGTNLYVTELSNNRVSQFTTAGAFVRAWGFDVDPAGGTGFETCTTGTTCKAGVSGEAAGQLSTPRGITVGAGGDVYVAWRRAHQRVRPRPAPSSAPGVRRRPCGRCRLRDLHHGDRVQGGCRRRSGRPARRLLLRHPGRLERECLRRGEPNASASSPRPVPSFAPSAST